MAIGYNVQGAELEVYYAFDKEYKIDLKEEPAELDIGYDDIDLLVKNGMDYIFITDYIYYFNKRDWEILAEAARKAFK